MLIGTDVAFAAQCVREGKLVVFPTETVYGLGANAFDPFAVARVFEVKERPSFDPLIVHISKLEQLDLLFNAPINERVLRLAEKFWPGPLTIVCEKKPEVPDIVTSGLSTVAVRMPSHPVALDLIEQAGTPIAAPSANKFGYLSPTQAKHVLKQLSAPDYLLDGGPTEFGIESTVVSVQSEGVRILRHGAIPLEELKKVVSVLSDDHIEDSLASPGLLKSHYSPSKPLFIIDKARYPKFAKGVGLIVSSTLRKNLYPDIKTLALSNNGDLNQMAVNLFSVLHAMEEDQDVEKIFIEPVSEIGVGKAIMERIRKAAYQYEHGK
jgi:L-threonylcarbamoyladenylate synthase